MTLDAAIAGPVIALPHRAQLERAFGRSLAGVPVHADAASRDALDARGAEAAAYRGHILLATPQAPLRTVAHEVAHVLQGGAGERAPCAPCMPSPAPQHAEVEAESIAMRAERRATATGDPMTFVPLQPQVQLAGGVLALRAARAPGADAMPAPPVRQAPVRTPDSDTARRANGRGVVGTIPRAAEQSSSEDAATTSEAERSTDGARAGEAVVDPLARANPAAQSTVSAEQVAAREAAIDAARNAVDGADSATGVIDAFATAPPTLKAQLSGEVGTRLDGALQQERTALDEATPEIAVDIDHGEAATAPGPLVVEAPVATAVVLEPGAPGAVAGAEVESTTLDETPDLNADIATSISRIFGGTPAADPASIDAALSDVSTANPGIPTSAGPAPTVPLDGANDPGRIEAQSAAGAEQVAIGLEAAQAAVIDGPGPDVVQPQSMSATAPLGELPAVGVEAQGAPSGPSDYLALGLPPEVQVAFDEQNAAGMEASLADAQQQAVTATTERDTQHAAAVSEAETARDDARATAELDQQAEVADARGTIETEREATLAAQQAEVDRVQGEADAQRELDRAAADTRIADDQAQIDDEYAAADREAQDEVAAGERDADAERAQAERDAEEESWFDRAVGWIRDAFNALVSAIGSIFDAVRRAVNAILDAVRDFAIGLINAIATFLQELIAAFGAFLVGLIDTLLGSLFPELAAALTRAVNAAVDVAQRAVAAVADTLRSAVNAIVEGLRRGINALLDVYQAALNAVAAVVNAVLTGDWTALLRMAFEAVLRVLGIDPAAAYAFLGRAEETLRQILEAPGTFLGNLVGALTGGIEAFAGRFLTHLMNGIIGWLTGALGGAGITIPPRFDLLGVLSLVGQVLGLTWQRLRERVVRVIGERAMAVLDFVAGYVETLVTGGFGALWEQITADLAMLRDLVIGMIRDWLVENVITAAVLRLATMFNPVGALLNIVMTIWNVYTFIRDQLQRLVEVGRAVLGAINEIAMGVLATAIGTVETTLGALLPLALDFLARLMGLGNVGGRVREILQEVQAHVWAAIDGFIGRVRGMFRGDANARAGAAPGGAGRDANAPGATTTAGAPAASTAVPTTPDAQQAALRAAVGEADRLLAAPGATIASVEPALPAIRDRFHVRTLTIVVDDAGTPAETRRIHATINPEFDGPERPVATAVAPTVPAGAPAIGTYVIVLRSVTGPVRQGASGNTVGGRFYGNEKIAYRITSYRQTRERGSMVWQVMWAPVALDGGALQVGGEQNGITVDALLRGGTYYVPTTSEADVVDALGAMHYLLTGTLTLKPEWQGATAIRPEFYEGNYAAGRTTLLANAQSAAHAHPTWAAGTGGAPWGANAWLCPGLPSMGRPAHITDEAGEVDHVQSVVDHWNVDGRTTRQAPRRTWNETTPKQLLCPDDNRLKDAGKRYDTTVTATWFGRGNRK